MILRNPDGSQYNVVGSLQQFDPENPEHCLFNQWDAEAIRIGGSPIFYYEMFIQVATLDPIYREDRGKIFSNHPVQLFCYYEPVANQKYQNMFGIDGLDEMVFSFNYQDVLNTIGHPPKLGSRMFTPHLRENWVIVQRNLEEYKLWGALRIDIFCKKFQESTTTGEGRVTQKQPDFAVDEIGR
jgi:hypothetical protein